MGGRGQEAGQHDERGHDQRPRAAAARLVTREERDARNIEPHADRQQPFILCGRAAGGRHAEQPVERPTRAHDGRPQGRRLRPAVIDPDRGRERGSHERDGRMARYECCRAGKNPTEREQAVANTGRRAEGDEAARQRPLRPLSAVDVYVEDVVEHHAGRVETEARGDRQPERQRRPAKPPRLRHDQEAGEHVGHGRRMVGQPEESQPGEQMSQVCSQSSVR